MVKAGTMMWNESVGKLQPRAKREPSKRDASSWMQTPSARGTERLSSDLTLRRAAVERTLDRPFDEAAPIEIGFEPDDFHPIAFLRWANSGTCLCRVSRFASSHHILGWDTPCART